MPTHTTSDPDLFTPIYSGRKENLFGKYFPLIMLERRGNISEIQNNSPFK